MSYRKAGSRSTRLAEVTLCVGRIRAEAAIDNRRFGHADEFYNRDSATSCL